MLCPNCGTKVPDGISKCLSCGSRIHAAEVVDSSMYEGYSSASEQPESTGSGGNKGISMFLGGVEAMIGLFVSLIAIFIFSSNDMGFGIFIASIFFCWAVVLPVIGVILVGVNKNKVGGVLIIIGSIPCIPIGIIGGIAGRLAFTLSD